MWTKPDPDQFARLVLTASKRVIQIGVGVLYCVSFVVITIPFFTFSHTRSGWFGGGGDN